MLRVANLTSCTLLPWGSAKFRPGASYRLVFLGLSIFYHKPDRSLRSRTFLSAAFFLSLQKWKITHHTGDDANKKVSQMQQFGIGYKEKKREKKNNKNTRFSPCQSALTLSMKSSTTTTSFFWATANRMVLNVSKAAQPSVNFWFCTSQFISASAGFCPHHLIHLVGLKRQREGHNIVSDAHNGDCQMLIYKC